MFAKDFLFEIIKKGFQWRLLNVFMKNLQDDQDVLHLITLHRSG